MNTVHDLQNLRWVIAEWKHQGVSIAFVPTMGNLHAGHLSLLKEAKRLADRTVVSIFVNPIQFGKGEDYEGYPSTLEADSRKLQAGGLGLLFAPDLKQLYPAGVDADTRVTVPQLSNILCGKFRPEHFSGVATVVCKLFTNVQPDIALFGEKDYQQLLVIKRMTTDLCMPVEIIGMPILREADGLAMSSRNSYLKAQERQIAPFIYQTLLHAAEQLQQDPAGIAAVESQGMRALEEKGFRPEYFSVRRSEDLQVPGPGDTRLSILAAAWLGSARLIDNIQVQPGML
ncbi:MAG: pantoate--beta-alanine ligase [Gammaproteobacteria bacterium RIFCSPLOWO2_02_FULL_52_10]|nr:MAG: pantoate--beta-alanine ligase [Gammaproteobacteria bacterium RIFCSPLOWO2_02_FULL_52_10]